MLPGDQRSFFSAAGPLPAEAVRPGDSTFTPSHRSSRPGRAERADRADQISAAEAEARELARYLSSALAAPPATRDHSAAVWQSFTAQRDLAARLFECDIRQDPAVGRLLRPGRGVHPTGWARRLGGRTTDRDRLGGGPAGWEGAGRADSVGGAWLPGSGTDVCLAPGVSLSAGFLYRQPRPALPPAAVSWPARIDPSGTLELPEVSPSALLQTRDRAPLRWLPVDAGAAGRPARSGRSGPTPRSSEDAAAILAVRLDPSRLAVVCLGSEETVRRPQPGPRVQEVLAVLHGVGPTGVLLEETAGPCGARHFAVCTVTASATRIYEAWQDLDLDGSAAVSVHVFIPGPERPRRLHLALQSGVARLSSDGVAWQRSLPEDRWVELFESALSA